jgi:hypothetical protein
MLTKIGNKWIDFSKVVLVKKTEAGNLLVEIDLIDRSHSLLIKEEEIEEFTYKLTEYQTSISKKTLVCYLEKEYQKLSESILWIKQELKSFLPQ